MGAPNRSVRRSRRVHRPPIASLLLAMAAVLLGVPAVAATASVAAAGPAGAAPAVPGATHFVAIDPVRLADTRNANPGATPAGRPGDSGTITVVAAGRGGIPANATAVVVNVTATGTAAAGFVTVFPSGGTRPVASNLNPERADQTIPDLVTVPLGAGGAVDVFTLKSADLVVDAFGYYVPATSARDGRFVPSGPARAYDSRTKDGPLAAGEARTIDLGSTVASDASAVVLNVTVTDTAAAGYWTVYPGGAARPNTSNLNVSARGETFANQVIVALHGPAVTVFAQTGGQVVVDVTGYFTGAAAADSADGLFVPITPTRFLDTRTGLNPLGPGQRLYQGWTVEVPTAGRAGVPQDAAAVVATTTLTQSYLAGFVTAYPAGTPRPNSSTVNATRSGQTIANHAIVPLGDRGLALFAQTGGHLIVDVSGWFVGIPRPSTQPAPANPPHAQASLPGTVSVPSIGITAPLYEGIDDATINAGPGHWPGTALPGDVGNSVVFGHRTSHSHPFLDLDQVNPGDPVVVTAGGRTFTYVVIGTKIIAGDDESVLIQTPTPTISLVACHPPHSTAYRIVVTAQLVGATGS